MEIGTADVIEKLAEERLRRKGLSGGTGSGGGGGYDGGGGDDRSDNDDLGESDASIASKSRIFTAFLLIVVLMTFGGLMAAYVVIATNNVPEWKPFDLPVQVWISTIIILISSVTYHVATTAFSRDEQLRAKKWLLATTVLGAVFISSQILSWVILTGRGLYVESNPYAGFFYILTAVHAVHVVGGITALSAVLLRSWFPTAIHIELVKRKALSQAVGWYWDFMGGIWIVVFVLLGFWK
jgi:cytochrome c oxidase subunit III